MLHHLTPADLKLDGAAVALAAAPFAFLSSVPAAVWLSLLSILVTAYFRRQELKLRREELSRREELRQLRERVAGLTAAPTAGTSETSLKEPHHGPRGK